MFRVAGGVCALPAASIEETLRPPATLPIPDTPDFVLGAAIVRGNPIPIVDAGALLSASRLTDASRVIVVKLPGDRRAGLLVSGVIGVESADILPVATASPLLAGADAKVVEALGRRDNGLLTVLQLGTAIPEEAWSRIRSAEAEQ